MGFLPRSGGGANGHHHIVNGTLIAFHPFQFRVLRMGEKVVFQNGTAILGFLLDAFPVDQVLCILGGILQQ